MTGFAVRTLIAALGLWIASAVVPGLEFSGTGVLLLAAALLGVVNAVVRPLVVLFTLPIAILTLGAFLWVINAAMLGLVAALLDGFRLEGFFPALFGALVVSVTSWIASWSAAGTTTSEAARGRPARRPARRTSAAAVDGPAAVAHPSAP